jgi:DNA invertase Pin-like site-specific DNA recombinase
VILTTAAYPELLGPPALQALISKIAAGKIDVVVVYKVDRLTRSGNQPSDDPQG